MRDKGIVTDLKCHLTKAFFRKMHYSGIRIRDYEIQHDRSGIKVMIMRRTQIRRDNKGLINILHRAIVRLIVACTILPISYQIDRNFFIASNPQNMYTKMRLKQSKNQPPGIVRTGVQVKMP